MPTLFGRILRRLSRPRLSLRATMIFVLLVGVGLGWVIARARFQAELVAEIERAKGHVRYDWPSRYSRSEDRILPERRIPKWLMRNLGPDYFSDVDAVQLLNDATPPVDEAFAARLGRLHRLELLHFPPLCKIDDAGLSHLSGLTRLQDLDLPGSGVTGAGLVHLSGMRKLERLKLGSIPLRDEHLAPLSGLTKLRELRLTGDRLSDAGMSHLAPLTDLRELIIVDASSESDRRGKSGRGPSPSADDGDEEGPMLITSRGLGALSGMKRLRCLSLPSSRIEDLTPIRGLTALRELYLPDARVTDRGLAAIAELANLDRLVLGRNTRLTDAGIIHLSGLKTLRTLSLYETAVGDAGLAAIGRISTLTSLNLGGTRVTDAGLASLAGLKNLDHLNLSGTRVTGTGLGSLAGLTRLESLSLIDSGVTDEGLAGVAQLSGLEHLSLWRTAVTVDGVARLAGMPSLRHLSLDGTGLSDADLPRLKIPPSCRVLGVWQTGLTPAGIATLRARYPGVEIRDR